MKTQSGRIPAANPNSTVLFRTVLLFAGGYRRFWVSARKCGKQGRAQCGKAGAFAGGQTSRRFEKADAACGERRRCANPMPTDGKERQERRAAARVRCGLGGRVHTNHRYFFLFQPCLTDDEIRASGMPVPEGEQLVGVIDDLQVALKRRAFSVTAVIWEKFGQRDTVPPRILAVLTR